MTVSFHIFPTRRPRWPRLSLSSASTFYFLQASFTHTAYFMVAHPSKLDGLAASAIFIYGLACTYVEYQIDHQKERFRTEAKAEDVMIWGQPAKYLVALLFLEKS